MQQFFYSYGAFGPGFRHRSEARAQPWTSGWAKPPMHRSIGNHALSFALICLLFLLVNLGLKILTVCSNKTKLALKVVHTLMDCRLVLVIFLP